MSSIYPNHKLGDLIRVKSGFAFKSSDFGDEGYPIIRISNIQEGKVTSNGVARISAANLGKGANYLVVPGDILIAMSGATTGKIGVVGEDFSQPAYLNQRVGNFIIHHPHKLDKSFLRFFLNSHEFQVQIHNAMAGVAQPNISGSQLEDIPIPLPPLAEQKRIAAILDQADVLRVKRRTALARLDALVQAVFLEMFGDPVTNPMGWEEKTLGDVIYFAKDGPHVSPIYVDKGIPFLSTRNIRAGQVIWEEMKYISRQDAEVHWEKCKPENGDILYTKGGTTGLAKAIDFHDEIAIWVHIALLKTMHEKVHPLWLENMLNSQYCYTQSQRYTRGIANRDLGLNRMVNIKIYTPPLLLQKQFAEHVAKIDKQRQHMQQSVGTLDLLFYSLQQRAFRGEL